LFVCDFADYCRYLHCPPDRRHHAGLARAHQDRRLPARRHGRRHAAQSAICWRTDSPTTDGDPHLAPIANAGHAPQADAGTLLTEVELTWLEGRHRALGPLRSRRGETILDCRRRTLSFTPRNVFGRWLSLQRLRHHHLAHRHRACGRPWRNLSDQMVFFVRPGGDILLRIRGWPKVEQVLQAIDAVEALSINPADADIPYEKAKPDRL
jgi:hypothetical protein